MMHFYLSWILVVFKVKVIGSVLKRYFENILAMMWWADLLVEDDVEIHYLVAKNWHTFSIKIGEKHNRCVQSSNSQPHFRQANNTLD